MKTLTPSQCLAIGTASHDEAADAASRLIMGCPSFGGGSAAVIAAWNAGLIEAKTVKVDGVPSYVIFYRLGIGGCLDVEGVAGIPDGKSDFGAMIRACEEIATANNCHYARFESARAGMVEQIQKHGGRPVAVVYTRPNTQWQQGRPNNPTSQGEHD